MRHLPILLIAAAIGGIVGCQSIPSQSDLTPTAVDPVSAKAGEQRIADQVILITDASGTMVNNQSLPTAKAITRSLISALPDGNVRSERPKPYQAGSIVFGGEERITHSLSAFNRQGLAGKASQIRPLGSIDGRGGETPYRHVFAEVSQQLSGKNQHAAIVLISDGLPDQPDSATAAAQALISNYAGQVCIHTIQTSNDPAGGEYLRSLAALSGDCGSAHQTSEVTSAAGLQAFIRQIMMGAAKVVEKDPCDDVIRLRGVRFAFDKSEITPDSAVVLDVAAEQIVACPKLRVRVEGHTDFIGTEDYNQGLSERRANAVRDYLSAKGVSTQRMVVRGFGESRPLAPGRTDEDRAINRRVELHPIQ